MGACVTKSEGPSLPDETWASHPGPSSGNSYKSAIILTNAQRAIITRTWPTIVQEMASNGVSVMLKLLDSRPEAKFLFDFRNKSGNDMVLDRGFRTHSYRFVQAVNAVLENLDNAEETIGDLLFRLGKKHVELPDFEPSYFTMLPEMYCFVWETQLTERFTETTEKVWRVVFDYIVGKMKEGYEAESTLREKALMRRLYPDRGLEASTSSWGMASHGTVTESEKEMDARSKKRQGALATSID